MFYLSFLSLQVFVWIIVFCSLFAMGAKDDHCVSVGFE
jgi:hypothetical protein